MRGPAAGQAWPFRETEVFLVQILGDHAKRSQREKSGQCEDYGTIIGWRRNRGFRADRHSPGHLRADVLLGGSRAGGRHGECHAGGDARALHWPRRSLDRWRWMRARLRSNRCRRASTCLRARAAASARVIGEPERPAREALLARSRFAGLYDDELRELLARATPIVIPENR